MSCDGLNSVSTQITAQSAKQQMRVGFASLSAEAGSGFPERGNRPLTKMQWRHPFWRVINPLHCSAN